LHALISHLDLDGAHVQYSYTQPSFLTLTVDGQNGQYNSSALDTQEWHLPTFDPRNENKYMYRLHTVDIYFWTKEDALQFVNVVRRVLPKHQVTVMNEPIAPPPHADDMSPVVQKLENVAITDPSYQQGRTRDSRTTSSVVPGPPSAMPQSQEANKYPGSGFNQQAVPQSQETSTFSPMAYNPAAPAAPEAIKHREKTPPPEDGAANPLVAAATSDQGQTYGVPFQFSGGGFSGPPLAQQAPSYFTGPPGQQNQPQSVQSPYAGHFQNSFAPPPVSALNPPPGPPAYKAQESPQVTQYPNYPGSPGFSPPMSTPGIYSPGLSSSMPAPGAYNPNVAPPGGFAQYNYNPSLSGTQPLMNDYSIHQQVYRPTENESAIKTRPAKPPAGKLEANAGKIEKGLTGLLKRVEKKIG
jgi:hypothetical protein